MKSRIFNDREIKILWWIINNAKHPYKEDKFWEKMKNLYFLAIENDLQLLRQETWEDNSYFPSEKLLALKCYLSHNVRGFRRAFRNIQGQMVESRGGQHPFLNSHITNRRPARR